MKNIIYSQNRNSEMVKFYFIFLIIFIIILFALISAFISKEEINLLFAGQGIIVGSLIYFFFKDFFQYGADIEINSENFIINNRTFDFSSLAELGQCKNRQLIYFIFRENDKSVKFVGFNRFTNKELFILNDKTRFVDMIKKLTNTSDNLN